MKYLHTMVRVHNLESSLAFYIDALGMKEIRRYDSTEGKYTNVFLAAPSDVEGAEREHRPLIELTYNWPDAEGNTETYTGGRNFGHIAFEVDNIYDTCAHLESKGITINRPPRDGRMAFVKSPDGISIELLQSDSPLPLKAPWKDMSNSGSW